MGDHVMPAWNPRFITVVAAMFLATLSAQSWATEQAQQRRAGRDVRQDTRQGSRNTKQECRATDQKSNSQCRQDKRQTKQHGRQTARDIKY
jgi:Flp pilus assembly protein TadB